MQDTTISAADLRALLDVAEGFTSENGLDAVARYAVPDAVQKAIDNAAAAMGEPNVTLLPNGPVDIQS